MEKAKKSRKCKTPGSKKSGINMDFITGLERSERNFQAKMMEIFQKYDRPFVNDIVVNIEDFTYETPEGRCPWTFETTLPEYGSSEDIVNEEHISETEDSKETQWTLSKKTSSIRKPQDLSPVRKPVTCDSPKKNMLSSTFEVGKFSGQTSCALMQKKKEKNPYTDDHKGFALTQNSDLGVMRKTIPVALPFKSTPSKQVNRFIDVNNEKCLLKSPGRYSVAVCRADDSGLLDYEEASYSESGNKTLEEFYPQMINNFSRLWDFDMKTQAANNIVQHYRRQIWFKKKKVFRMKMFSRHNSFNKTYTMCSAPNVGEIVTVSRICDSTLSPEECVHKPGLQEPFKIHSPGLFSRVHKLDSPSVPVTIGLDPQGNANKTIECIIDYQTLCMDSPFPARLHVVKKSAMSPGYCTSASSSSCQVSISSAMDITNKSQMDSNKAQSPYCKDSKHLQQNFRTLSRRNSFSGFPMLQSPKKMAAKHNCCMNEKTKTLSEALMTQSLMTDEKNHASYKEHMKLLQNKTCTLTRRNSFSVFPVAHRENRDFESLYKNVSQARPQPDFSLCKAQVQVSKTVSSLVYSPGSLRAKRPLSHDFSFSMSKKPRSATEALIGSSKPLSHSMDSRDVLWSEPSSSLTLHHSVVASSLPSHMLPPSPVSLRSFSPGVNGGSPKRTNPRTYRKLSYQEDNGTIARN